MRSHTNRKLDKKVFRNTANTIKTENIRKKPERGGIRL